MKLMNYSETESEEEEILTESDIIEDFNYNYSIPIQKLSTDLESRFHYFLDKRGMYSNLYTLILDMYLNQKIQLYFVPNLFINANETEINTTLFVINNYLHTNFKKLQINKNIWINFCFENTF
jgi:hypothetical protein